MAAAPSAGKAVTRKMKDRRSANTFILIVVVDKVLVSQVVRSGLESKGQEWSKID
jgi:hypothetical protein